MTFIGKAWRGFQRFIQDVRIDADFPRYESEQRASHESEADRRFDASQLEREIKEIRSAAEAEGLATFGAEMHRLESCIGSLQAAIHQNRVQLDLLTRDYKLELDQLYAEKGKLIDTKQSLLDQKRALQVERSGAHAELNDAHSKLRQANSSINGWYAKSDRTPWLFGNGGKRLPQRSMFGQSFGDLNGYKAARDRAGEEIGACKEAVARIVAKQKSNNDHLDNNRTALDEVSAAIKEVKAARQLMFELKDRGVRRHRVTTELAEQTQQELSAQKELSRLSTAKAELVQQQACRMGLEERRRAVEELIAQRERFLAKFDRPEQKSMRKQAHRQSWLRSREAADFSAG